MCTYITGVLVASANTLDFRGLVAWHKLAFEELSNPHVRAQLQPSERYYRATRRPCDCGTDLGLTDYGERVDTSFEPTSVATLRKKGWGEAKIARWLEATRESRRKADEADRIRDAARGAPENWISFLNQALALPEVPFVGLIVREYFQGDLQSARFTVAGRVAVDVGWLRDPSRRWVDGRLYEFTTSGHGV